MRFLPVFVLGIALAGPAHAFECKFTSVDQQQRCLAELATVQVFMNVKATGKKSNREIQFESQGSGFIIDSYRNLLITAKHVVMGERVWSPDLEDMDINKSIDAHSSIEGFIRTFGKLHIRTEKGTPLIEAELIALDRYSDVALLRYGGKSTLLDTRIGAPFQRVRLARGCTNGMNIFGAGYPDSLKGDFDRTLWKQIDDCRLVSTTYDGGLPWYSALLYRSNAAFESGMSGGPVLDQNGRVVGMVAGSTANGKRGFIVPVGAIRRFISQLGIDAEIDE